MLRIFTSAIFLLLFSVADSAAAEARLFTLWPLVDYRADAEQDFRSLHLLGPLIKRQEDAKETVTALRPLFYTRSSGAETSRTNLLYPLCSQEREGGFSQFNCLHLLYGDARNGGQDNSREFYLFPFLFYENAPDQPATAAFFPLGGTLRNWFRRDQITFALFPLYGRTQQGDTRVDNVLWPFFARLSGEDESGFKFWPLYGASHKTGVYQKSFFLWPIFFAEDLALDTERPIRKRAAWPFYVSIDNGKSRYTAVLWPFFSRQMGLQEPYAQWNFPWPLLRSTRGEQRHGFRFLPFYADETVKNDRTVWFLWPIYKREELHTDVLRRRRHRILFFLFSDVLEQHIATGEEERRVDFWPLFSYAKTEGVSHLHLFSLLEPFFPGNRGIEEGWAPLWRVYQQKWDSEGNRIASLLWNLYWRDQRADGRLAWELFPLIEFRRRSASAVELRLLKGLFSYHAEPSGERFLKILYLPWELSLGKESSGARSPEPQ